MTVGILCVLAAHVLIFKHYSLVSEKTRGGNAAHHTVRAELLSDLEL